MSQPISIAQALRSTAFGLLVADTAADIANALPNPALTSRVASFTVSGASVVGLSQLLALATLGAKLHASAGSLVITGPAIVSVAQLGILEALPGFTTSVASQLTLSDTTANIVGMLAAHPAWFTQVTAIAVHLDGTAIGAYPAVQLNGLAMHGHTLSFVASGAFTTLPVTATAHDLGSNAASLNALALHQPLTLTLTNPGATVSAADAVGLTSLSGFVVGAHALNVADSGVALEALAPHVFGAGFTQIQVTSGTFAGSSVQLLDPALHFAASAQAALAVSASVGGTTAALLAGLPGFTLVNQATLTVADTAGALATTESAWLHTATNATLTVPASVNAATQTTLELIATTLPGGLSLGGNTLAVSDTLSALLALSPAAANLATSLVLNADTTATAAQLVSFANLPNAGLGGHAITAVDTAGNLLGLSGAAFSDAHGFTLSASASISAGQLALLAALPNFNLGGYTLAVSGTAGDLLNLSPTALAFASSLTLSADASVSAQSAQALFAQADFSTGGHHLIVSDTAANLLGLPAADQLAATSLALSDDEVVTAAVLTRLSALGIKFSEAGHLVTCADTAADLASLSPAAQALAGVEVVDAPSVVSAATYALLAALPHLVTGAPVTVQDSLTNLLGMATPAYLPNLVQLLPGTVVTLTAAQAADLARIPGFSAHDATITVADSVANLNAAANAGWPLVAAQTHVQDSAANLAAGAAAPPVSGASEVSLSANGTIGASQAAQIAQIGHFITGAYTLTVADTAAAIAAQAGAILLVATGAVVTDSGPVNAAGAAELAALSQAGKLSFLGGDQLLVQDSFAALTNPAYSAGITLASRLAVVDTANTIASAAASHDWGGINPSYILSQPGTVSAGQAIVLAGLGTHFSAAANALSVADNAAAVVGAGAALLALHATAVVSDSGAAIGAQAAALHLLGAAISAVVDTDTQAISATTAAGIAALAAKLTGPPIAVADTASGVNASLAGLITLGTHVAIALTDTASDVAAVAANLATLSGALAITLTDMVPISATTAAGLVPVVAELVAGTRVPVTDAASAIVADATPLLTLGSALGTITLQDGTTQSAATAAALLPLQSHLAHGVMLTVAGSGADITAYFSALQTLQADNRLANVVVYTTSVNDAVSNATALNLLGAHVTISDTALHVDGALASLGGINGLQSISLSDAGTPALAMNLGTLSQDAAVIGKIVTPYSITLADSAAAISADLAQGTEGTILAHLAHIGAIITTDENPITLTQNQLLQTGVDDGPGSALALYAGPLHVTFVDLLDLNAVATRAHSPNQISVNDSGAAISGDLARGLGQSALLAHLGVMDSITDNDGTAVTLTAAQALATGVDDNPASAIAKLAGGTLSVTHASILQLGQFTNLVVQPSSIAVLDNAAALSADLASGHSSLVALLPTIGTITVQDGGVIALTEQQLLALHVDDGTGSVLSHVSGGSLAVTGALAADLGQLLTLGVPPGSIAITDSAAHVLSHLATVEADLAHISSITITGGPLVLSADEALASGADDGAGSLASLITGGVFDVTGASVSQFDQLLTKADVPQSMSISDSSAHIVADLLSGASALAANIAGIGGIAVTHGTLALSDPQAETILHNPALDAVFAKLAASTIVTVSGVSVADLPGIAASGWAHVTVALSDDPATIATDLALGAGSSINANLAAIGSVTLADGGTVNAQALTEMTALPGFSTGTSTLDVQDNAAAITGLSAASLGFPQGVSVVDSDAGVATAWNGLLALRETYAGALSLTLDNPNPAIAMGAYQYISGQALVDAITNPGVVTINDTAAAVAAIAPTLALDGEVGNISVIDTAADVIANLTGLLAAGGKLSITLTDASLTAAEVAPLLALANRIPVTLGVSDTGAQIASVLESGNVAAINYLQTHLVQLADSSPVSAVDAAALEQLIGLDKNGHQLVVWDTAAHLDSPAYASAIANGLVDSVHLKAPGGIAVVTAANAATLLALPGFVTTNPDGSANTLTVSDTAAHIEANLLAIAGHVSNIVVNTSATISVQVLTDLRGADASAAPNVMLTVRDSAAIIADNAGAPAGPGGIQPSAWTLASNGTVSAAEAVTLGNLAHFNAAGHTITIALGADTGISLADAQSLGNIASSLNLGGNHLLVTGSVAQLDPLSPAALALVKPEIVDSFANIAALPANSPLLHGTIEITDAASVNAQQVASVMTMASNLAPGAVVIDQPHAVVDSVADLFALASSVAWTHNVPLQSQFSLTAQDNVANLINPASTAFLSGLSATTLGGDNTTDAASATALANLAPTIHFVHGAAQIVVSDTAADLLNPENAAGLALANTVTLRGPDQVDAADAESLLGIAHFSLTTPLAIVDSSANLLDGVLGGDITGSGFASHITVQLAGPETLDADTAEQLVTLPGFANTQNLTIADDPSYLLNSANLSAEQIATSVTLAGDETVSANTILRLSEIPHFTPGDSHLVLAGSDFADAATLKAIADDGSAIVVGSNTIAMTQDVLDLTPTELNALVADNLVLNGHLVGVVVAGLNVSEGASGMNFAGTGFAGGTVSVYGANGLLLASDHPASPGFVVSSVAPGGAFTVTETIAGIEGAPLVALDASLLENAVALAHGTFATSGAIQVGNGEFLNLYNAGSVPGNLAHAALVYDPLAHTVSLEVGGNAPVTLITLGGTAHPASLDISEILITHHG